MKSPPNDNWQLNQFDTDAKVVEWVLHVFRILVEFEKFYVSPKAILQVEKWPNLPESINNFKQKQSKTKKNKQFKKKMRSYF